MGVKFLIVFFFIAGAFLVILNLWESRPQGEVLIYFPEQDLRIYAEVADNDLAREKGLAERESLGQDRGILFAFDEERLRSFWMKDVKIPLDLIFISGDKKIVDIKENFRPCMSDLCETYTAGAPAQYVLEINAGLVRKHGVVIGGSLRW